MDEFNIFFGGDRYGDRGVGGRFHCITDSKIGDLSTSIVRRVWVFTSQDKIGLCYNDVVQEDCVTSRP